MNLSDGNEPLGRKVKISVFGTLQKNFSTEFSKIALKVGKKLVLYDMLVILPEKIQIGGQILDRKTSRMENLSDGKNLKCKKYNANINVNKNCIVF